MTKEVMISIRGIQFENGQDGERIESIQKGEYYYKNNTKSFINYIINLDLMPEASLEDTIRMLEIRKELFESSDVASLLTGMLPKMIGSVIVKKASVDLNAYVKNLTKANITKIANLIKAFPLEIRGDYGFERSQVTVGGVALNEIDPNTLAIKKMNNAYICGEMIDIDGECGGYNLQWALASGYLVGCEIAGSTEEDA